MKKILLLLGLMLISAVCYGASGDTIQYGTITYNTTASTGTTAINLANKSTEIFWVRTTTSACYISYTGVLCDSTTNYELIPADASGYVSGSRDIQTTKISVFSDTPPFNIQIGAKSW